jgi:hypothetical protein
MAAKGPTESGSHWIPMPQLGPWTKMPSLNEGVQNKGIQIYPESKASKIGGPVLSESGQSRLDPHNSIRNASTDVPIHPDVKIQSPTNFEIKNSKAQSQELPQISREDTEAKLQGTRPGTWLVRSSKNLPANHNCISIKLTNGTVHHEAYTGQIIDGLNKLRNDPKLQGLLPSFANAHGMLNMKWIGTRKPLMTIFFKML